VQENFYLKDPFVIFKNKENEQFFNNKSFGRNGRRCIC